MQKLNVKFDKLKYIHHISDIQIRNLKRHTEYEEVFERTYKEIEKNKLIESKNCADLLEAYNLFRRLENLIQYQEDRQTHIFTDDLPCLNSFLKILNFNTFEALKKGINFLAPMELIVPLIIQVVLGIVPELIF